MKALKIISFCAWMIGSAGIMDLSGEFQLAAIALGMAGLTGIFITAKAEFGKEIGRAHV